MGLTGHIRSCNRILRALYLTDSLRIIYILPLGFQVVFSLIGNLMIDGCFKQPHLLLRSFGGVRELSYQYIQFQDFHV